MRIGVHCSIAQGLLGTLKEAEKLNCQTIQFFTRSPRVWDGRKIDNLEIRGNYLKKFKERQKFLDIFPLTLHIPYLPNLCSQDKKLYQKSLKVFIEDLKYAGLLNAEYLVFHPGSYSKGSNPEQGSKQLIKAINYLLKEIKNKVIILIETSSGGGRKIGWNFPELGSIVEKIKEKKRIGICFDTCHTYSAGYEISTKDGLEKTLNEFNQYIGIDKIKLLHTNDAKKPLGSKIDRHEHLGKGYIGLDGFRLILNHSVFKDLPAILETPKKNPSADKHNLSVLRKLIH